MFLKLQMASHIQMKNQTGLSKFVMTQNNEEVQNIHK
jgi:ferritin